MKVLKHLVVIAGMLFLLPVAANASPDDFDDITVEAVELDDHSSDSVTHDVEIPHAEDLDEHHGSGHDANEREHESEEEHEQENEEQHETEDPEGPEDTHEDHAEIPGDESVS